MNADRRETLRALSTVAFALALGAAGFVYRHELEDWFSLGEPRKAPPAESSASAGASASAGEHGDEIDHYTCSMHPSVRQKGPGKCPICGMDLIPVTRAQEAAGEVLIDSARRQLIGVRTGAVVQAPLQRVLRAVGQITYDESKLSDVNLKVQGWVTKLFVNETGQRVKAGQPLLLLYSPELYNAEQDFLLATQGASALPAPSGGAPSRVETLGRAARQRLHLLGLSDTQIDAISKKGAPNESVTIAAPASGFVIEKNVVEGASVDPGMRLFRIAALNEVWVEADVYEADLAHVHVGQAASVKLDYLPGQAYDAKVSYIYPYLDPKTRTGRVRVELANKALELRPGMYATVELASDPEPRLQVPASAVVYTGPRRLVFVDLGDGRFRPQEVRVGSEVNGMYEVLSGLAAGDVVATSGVFLIAAEARISTAAKYWDEAAPSDSSDATPTDTAPPMPTAMPEHAGHAPTPSPATPVRPRAAPPAPTRTVPSPPAPGAAASSTAPEATLYTCPMHPEIRKNAPGKCPICGMDLVPVAGAKQ